MVMYAEYIIPRICYALQRTTCDYIAIPGDPGHWMTHILEMVLRGLRIQGVKQIHQVIYFCNVISNKQPKPSCEAAMKVIYFGCLLYITQRQVVEQLIGHILWLCYI